MRYGYLAPLAAMAVVGCANTTGSEGPSSASASAPKAEKVSINENPYPSTYKPYPGVATAIRNVTIFDGEGGQIDNGVVFFLSLIHI